jgi:hypothetical protein
MLAQNQNLLEVCAHVTQSFSVLEAFATKHETSITGTVYYALIGALNIQRDETGFIHFRQMKPLQIARIINVDSKKVARWCSTLAECGLLTRKRGSYAIANVGDWHMVAQALYGKQSLEEMAAAPSVATSLGEQAFMKGRDDQSDVDMSSVMSEESLSSLRP